MDKIKNGILTRNQIKNIGTVLIVTVISGLLCAVYLTYVNPVDMVNVSENMDKETVWFVSVGIPSIGVASVVFLLTTLVIILYKGLYKKEDNIFVPGL